MRLRLLLALAVSLAACRTFDNAPSSTKEAPAGDNAPHWWGLTTMRYNDLPLKYSLPRMPWASDYWATYRGGIATRWQKANASEDYKRFLYKIPSAAQLAAMTDKEIDKLSPAEKYDLWQGRTDLSSPDSATGRQRQFVLDAAEFNRETMNADEIPTWTGICNGWSLAAINEPYPVKPVKVTAPNGRKITFYSGDIQALISQVYFDYQPAINVARLGAICDEPEPAKNAKGRIIRPACRDVNPMSLHLALARYLAQGKGFVFDVDAAEETWNQPIYGYEMAIGDKRAIDAGYANPAENATQLADVKVTLSYVVEADVAKVGMTEEQLKEYVSTVTYRYTLELDDDDNLVGGEWRKNSKLPDFLWKPDELPSDELIKGMDPSYPISYDKVKELVTASAAGH